MHVFCRRCCPTRPYSHKSVSPRVTCVNERLQHCRLENQQGFRSLRRLRRLLESAAPPIISVESARDAPSAARGHSVDSLADTYGTYSPPVEVWVVYEETATRQPGAAATAGEPQPPKILSLGGTHDAQVALRDRFGEHLEIVDTSPMRALSHLGSGEYIGIYADADHFAEVVNVARLVQNERILQGMPDGVALLTNDNTILWANGRLREWTGREDLDGLNFYDVMGTPEILGPDFCPFRTALEGGRPTASTLKCFQNRYMRIHVAPVSNEGLRHLVVTVREVTDEVLQQQKLNAIHQAGIELADLTPDEVAKMSVEERIELLKANILHCTKDVLHYDVVEIRMLDSKTKVLEPVLAVGMTPEAAQRKLRAEPSGFGVTGFVAATGKSYLCEDTSVDPLYLEGAAGARSSLTVPVMLHDRMTGTLNVESPEPKAFNESDLQFLEIFARDVAIALNTLELLAAEKATTAAASVEAIHSAVALPVDIILNDAVNVMERYIGHQPDVVERLQSILRNARDIKQVIQKVGQSMAPAEAQPPSARVELRPALVGRRVLVVDADEGVRTAAHALLERYLCIVETAHDGSEAQFMVRSLSTDQRYDAIIADIRLPDMSGHQLLLKLKEMMETVPMALMTGFGYDPGHSIVKARQAGLQAVLFKPFRLDQLLEAVEQLVTRARQPVSG
jgi:two-component system, sensor histidine kinase SagS